MTAYKCDICGGFFAQQKFNIIESNSKDCWAIRLGDNINYADICPGCINALQEVIDARVNINDTEAMDHDM